ncbi:MAG: sigma-54-dependent Fis family transcriptional regulator, partial [Spirochaetia bacterium]|nr:sigma-54-dependent Fis family transcriptional regulator [Spirochaetia bacterium]
RKESLPKEIDAELVGSSVALMRVKNSILQYAPSPATVLLRGESGTGKGVVARLIHTHSSRHEGPFLSLNCGAIPENLMESELFGYERGAFTGAVNAKTGIFEQADGGTLFLDEIGELPQAMQVKLLKVLEDKVVRRLGGSREIPVNVRIVAATNKDLEKAFATREFREDLFYRLNVLSLNLPPLRERRDDVPALAKSLLVQMGREMNRPNLDFSPEAYEKMSSYDWPGNVRELKNIVERALIRGEAALIGADSLDLKTTVGHSVVKENLGVPVAAGSSVNFMEEVSKKGLSEVLESFEKGILEETMKRSGANQTKAAQALSIKRTTLVQKLKRYGLE